MRALALQLRFLVVAEMAPAAAGNQPKGLVLSKICVGFLMDFRNLLPLLSQPELALDLVSGGSCTPHRRRLEELSLV